MIFRAGCSRKPRAAIIPRKVAPVVAALFLLVENLGVQVLQQISTSSIKTDPVAIVAYFDAGNN